MKQKKIVLVSTLYSPFQIELAKEINKLNLEYHIIFTMNLENKRGENSRGSHWLATNDYSQKLSHIYDWTSVKDLAINLENELERLKPDVLLATGILTAPTFRALKKLKGKGKIQYPLGFWLESANTSVSKLKSKLMRKIISYQLKEMDFAFAIGSNALNYYSSLAPKLPIFDVPYGQDLSDFYNISRNTDTNFVQFLLSGQLLKRNNIKNIIKALYQLRKTRPGQWQLIISGSGPEKELLSKFANEFCEEDWNPIIFHREFKSWEDRVSPFKSSNVFLCPSLHAGWGLVIPEAVASGMPVITSDFVNSARRFVASGYNGFVISPEPQSIVRAMQFFIDNPKEIFNMGDRGRLLAKTGDASFVANLFEQNTNIILDTLSSKVMEQ